jgi:hypothetical protein
MLTPDQIICIPCKRNANGSIDIIMSNREGKVFCGTEADDRIALEATSHSMPGDQLFPWEELSRNCSRIDVLEWYIDIANEMNLSLQNITLFPMAVDHGSLTVCTSVCNMWYSYIDKLKAESNRGKKNKWVNPLSARCLSIIHHLITNYLDDGKNVGSHASQPRKSTWKNPPSLLPKSVFIESSINGSSEEMQSSTSPVKQLPEFERCRYNKNGEVIVNLQSVFDGAFANVKIKTISKQVVNAHQRKIKLWEARGTCFFRGYQMSILADYTPTNPSCNITLKDNLTLYYKKTSTIVALLWYNLTQGADAQWRMRWFRHLLGSESSVLLW